MPSRGTGRTRGLSAKVTRNPGRPAKNTSKSGQNSSDQGRISTTTAERNSFSSDSINSTQDLRETDEMERNNASSVDDYDDSSEIMPNRRKVRKTWQYNTIDLPTPPASLEAGATDLAQTSFIVHHIGLHGKQIARDILQKQEVSYRRYHEIL
jgi:hypothetical protein